MDKIYIKTRYQNIYRHSKNKNYIIRTTHPETTISKINGEKIFDIEIAKQLRDKKALNKTTISNNSLFFEDLWQRYYNHCENVSKLAFNTLKKKRIIYNLYLKEFDRCKIHQLTKEYISNYIEGLKTTDKQKNTILTILKGFFTYCIDEDIISNNPASRIKNKKVTKPKLEYWNAKQLKQFINYLNTIDTHQAKTIKILTLLNFSLGDRLGETRALKWSAIDKTKNTISIYNSINYDTKNNDYVGYTKNYQSQRIVDVSPKLIDELNNYKDYLINTYGEINDIIIWNYKLNKPYSDTNLRKYFYKFQDQANVPRLKLYNLRHTFATMMLSEGWELYHISKRMGHKNYSTTVNKYGDIESKTRKEIAKTTDKYY